MTTCPACQRDVPEERKDCPYCGVVFAKWKGHKAQPAAAPVLSNAASEQTEESTPDVFPPPPLTQSERADLIVMASYDSSDRDALAQKDRTALQRAGIYTEVRKEAWWSDEPESRVYVPRKHLLPAKVVLDLHANRLTLSKLASQPILIRQTLLIDAMVFIAEQQGRFKHALFPQHILAWYQTCADLTQQQMQTALSTAPRSYRSKASAMIKGTSIGGGIFIIVGYVWEKFFPGNLGEESVGSISMWIGGALLFCSAVWILSLISSEK